MEIEGWRGVEREGRETVRMDEHAPLKTYESKS